MSEQKKIGVPFLDDLIRKATDEQTRATLIERRERIVADRSKPAPLPVKRSADIIPIEKAQKPKTGFSAREMILLNLPHSDPKAPVWTRHNGNISLIVQGGYKPNKKTGKTDYLGIPYGAKARLILFFLMSEAALKNSRRVYLGDSFNAFLECLGTDKNRGGKDSGREAVKKQLQRILYSSFMVHHEAEIEEANIEQGSPSRFTGEFALWFSKKEGEQLALWDSFIDLSPELFESLKKSAVPLDWEILLKLQNSPLAIDLYAWLTYEGARAQQTGRGRFIPWASLKEQMGAEYGNVYDFARAAKRELAKIKKLYAGLSLGSRRAGIEIKADSLPSVERPALPPS